MDEDDRLDELTTELGRLIATQVDVGIEVAEVQANMHVQVMKLDRFMDKHDGLKGIKAIELGVRLLTEYIKTSRTMVGVFQSVIDRYEQEMKDVDAE